MLNEKKLIQNGVSSKLTEILNTKGLPPALKKHIKELNKEIPSYFKPQTFMSEEEIRKIVHEATSYSGWSIDIYDFGNDKKAKQKYCNYFNFDINAFESDVFSENCITYVLSRESNSKNELCGLEIQVQGIEINVSEQSLSASGPGFSCFIKDFKNKMKDYFSQR
jgi:hypothetical protein